MEYDLADVSFHEASLTSVNRPSDATFTLQLQGVHIAEHVCGATIVLDGVRSIERDGVPVGGFVMEFEDGEILTGEAVSNGFRILVEWNDFATHRKVTANYHFVCDTVSLENVR
jgi:hypothetical protein